MTNEPQPLPQRIGDAERDRAAGYLREHLAEGRLDQAEFDERLTKALTAKTTSDLEPLFHDLPGPKPIGGTVSTSDFQPPPWQQTTPAAGVAARTPGTAPVLSQAGKAWAIASAFAWPAAIIFSFATDWRYWWVMLIPIFFPWWLGRDDRRRRSHH